MMEPYLLLRQNETGWHLRCMYQSVLLKYLQAKANMQW